MAEDKLFVFLFAIIMLNRLKLFLQYRSLCVLKSLFAVVFADVTGIRVMDTFSTPELVFFILAARPKSSGKLRARVAKIWLYGLQSACPAVQKQNGGAASLKPCKSWKYSWHFCLKDEQKAIVGAVVCKKRDVLEALPTGFARSFYLSFAK